MLDRRRDLGLAVGVQPYVEEPARQVFLSVVAFNNAPGDVEVALRELRLLRPGESNPFRRLAVNQKLPSLRAAGLRTGEIRQILLPHPLTRKAPSMCPQAFLERYGSVVWMRCFPLDLAEAAPGLRVNRPFHVVVRAVFTRHGKEYVVQVCAEGTYLKKFSSPQVAVPEPPPGEAAGPVGARRGWFRADAHVHSRYSLDAPLAPIPDQVAAGACAGLACLVFTDHGDHFDPEGPRYAGRGSWWDQREEIRGGSWPIKVDNGEEITRDPQLRLGRGAGHALAYDLVNWVPNYYSSPYSSNQAVIDAINADNAEAFGGPAHPGFSLYPWNRSISEAGVRVCELFDALGGLDTDAVRMWDAYHASRLASILAGSPTYPRLAGTANSDAHNPWEVARYSTWFYSADTPADVDDFYTALRNAGVVASQSPSFACFKLNGQMMGSVMEIRDGTNLRFEVAHVARGYATNHVCRVFIVRNDDTNRARHVAYRPARSAVSSSCAIGKGHRLYPTRDGYYRVAVRFRHRDSRGRVFWSWTLTQPIFFALCRSGRPGQTGGVRTVRGEGGGER